MTSKKHLSKRILCTIMALCFLAPLFSIAPAFASPAPEGASDFPRSESYWGGAATGFNHPELTVSWASFREVGALVEGKVEGGEHFYDVFIGGSGGFSVELNLAGAAEIASITGGTAGTFVSGASAIDGVVTVSLNFERPTAENIPAQVSITYSPGAGQPGAVASIRFQRAAATAVAVTGSGKAYIARTPLDPDEDPVFDDYKAVASNTDGIMVMNEKWYTYVLFSPDAESVTIDDELLDIEDMLDVGGVFEVAFDGGDYYALWLGDRDEGFPYFTTVIIEYAASEEEEEEEDDDDDDEEGIVDAELPVIYAQPKDATYPQFATPASLFVMAETPDDGDLSYQWYFAEAGEDGEPLDFAEVPGAEEDTLDPYTDTIGVFFYYVEVTNTNESEEITGETTATIESDIAKITVVAQEEIVPVEKITVATLNGTVGVELQLKATVAPENATFQDIVWSRGAGGTVSVSDAVVSTDGKIGSAKAGAVAVVATIAFGGEDGEDFVEDFTITFFSPPTYSPGGGAPEPTPTPTPAPAVPDPTLPAADVAPAVAADGVQEEAVDAVEEFNGNWASDVEQAGDAVDVKLPKEEPTVVTLTDLPESVDAGDVTVMAILNPDGTLTPVPTRIIGGKIVVVLEHSGTLVPLHVAAAFNDLQHVPADVLNEINKAASLAVIEGFPSGEFKPSEKVTVQQAVAMFLRASGIKTDYATAMAAGLENKLIGEGMTGSDSMSRIQTAQLIVNALAHFGLKYTLTGDDIDKLLAEFADMEDLDAAEREALAVTVKLGIFKGFTDHTMRPGDILNRSQMASLAVRMQDVLFDLA